MIDKGRLSRMLKKSAELLLAESSRLSDIDSKYGDGDHGITITKIAKVIDGCVDAWEDDSIKEFFDDLGMQIMAVRGGSAGPLYGTMVGGLGAGLEDDEREITPAALKRMFAASLAEMQDITPAHIGDKTMMDALVPAAMAVQDAAGDECAILQAASEAAARGAKASEGFVSKFGRARSYGEATIGTPDAGAVSTSIFIDGLYRGACE